MNYFNFLDFKKEAINQLVPFHSDGKYNASHKIANSSYFVS
jgi:hypothetical protein